MNSEDYTKLRRLLAAATPGPWHEGYWDGQHHVGNGEVPVTGDLPRVPDKKQSGANAALIVAAVNALPGLLTALAELRSEAEQWKLSTEHGMKGRDALRAKVDAHYKQVKYLTADRAKVMRERDAAQAFADTLKAEPERIANDVVVPLVAERNSARSERDALKAKNSELIVDHVYAEAEWNEWTRGVKAENIALKTEVERLSKEKAWEVHRGNSIATGHCGGCAYCD